MANRTFAVTLMYRRLGRALASHIKAASSFDGELEWLQLYGGNHGNVNDIVLKKYCRARRQFLDGNSDVFVTIEDDMIIPEDAIARLHKALDNGADIAYGLYCWRISLSGGGWSAYVRMTEDEGQSVLIDTEACCLAFSRKDCIPVVGVGLGCTAIKRHVLEAIDFRRGGKHANDWYFALDCRDAGFTQVCDLGIRCGHIAMEPTPRIIWPSIDNDLYQRIEYLGD